MQIFYFMGPEFLRDNLQKSRLKVSRFGQFGNLNDPFELNPYDTSNAELRRRYKEEANHFAKTHGLICFSERWQSPAMWAHYTDNYKGACLSFEVRSNKLFKVGYHTEKLTPRNPFSPFFKPYDDDFNFREVLATKSKDWEYENEVRLLVDLKCPRVIQDSGIDFLPMCNDTLRLKEVYVGFRCALGIHNLEKDVQGYASKVSIRQTRPGFHRFQVEVQREPKYWNWEEGSDVKLPAERAHFGFFE